jgi:hypothetical protein
MKNYLDYLEEMKTSELWKFLTILRQKGSGNSELANEIQTIMVNRLWEN